MEPTLSQTLRANDDQERMYGKVDMDTKYPDVNDNNVKSGDIANTLASIKYDGENFNSVSVYKKDITKLGDIVAKISSSQTQVQEYFSPEGAQTKQASYSYGKHYALMLKISVVERESDASTFLSTKICLGYRTEKNLKIMGSIEGRGFFVWFQII